MHWKNAIDVLMEYTNNPEAALYCFGTVFICVFLRFSASHFFLISEQLVGRSEGAVDKLGKLKETAKTLLGVFLKPADYALPTCALTEKHVNFKGGKLSAFFNSYLTAVSP